MISIDSETTGVDVKHASRPFFITIAQPDGKQLYWEFSVDPYTREVQYEQNDILDINKRLAESNEVVGQNIKFDAGALDTLKDFEGIPWHKTHDTLLAAHLLASNKPKNLTALAVMYLGINIQKYEDELEKCVKECRRLTRKKDFIAEHGKWIIADEGVPGMPSVKKSASGDEDKAWKYDSWLPRAIATRLELPKDHQYWSVTAEYANTDSAVTLALWAPMREEICRRGLWEIYLCRRKLLPIVYDLERRGITLSKSRLEALEKDYRGASEDAKAICENIASDYGFDLKMPKGGNNKKLTSFIFDVMKLPPVKYTDKGNPSLDKGTIEHWALSLPPRTKEHAFCTSLQDKRKADTAVSYVEGYKRFWLPYNGTEDVYVLYPSVNPTGTDTLRWSFKNPNSANISKQEGFNQRKAFGPASDREWWSPDADNIELRIPVFEAKEDEPMAVYNNPHEPPYYGSYHLVVFDALHPELFKKYGAECKTLFEDTYYQWVKNGNFAIQYGAQEAKADATYHVKGAYKMLQSRFPKIARLNRYYQAFAKKHGYVETIPDKTVNPNRGYPILCSRSEYGDIIPTTPFCYHVSGTAMQWMCKAMIRCNEQLEEWRRQGFDAWIAAQVHDELVFDFPKGSHPLKDPKRSNLARAKVLKKLMEQGGDDIGIPTTVTLEYNETTWAEGIKLKV